ncbi:MAG: STAS domain-containing protein [Phycisphaerales bacterium]|jgi:anti-anti-sigma factor
MDEEIDLNMHSEGEVSVVSFQARSISDYNGISAASEKIRKFVEENSPRAVVFDFGQVKFFSSQVLGLLLEIRARLKSSESEVVISSIDPQLYRVFKITNLDKIFRFFDSKEKAIEALAVG